MVNGQCMLCDLGKPPFLHHVYHNNNYLQLCTSCLLNVYRGAYCPICFQVYEPENPNPSSDLVNCYCCPAITHLSCINSGAAATSTSISITIRGVPYICRSCADPNFNFFNLGADEKTKMLMIDQHFANQLIAASVISERTMKEAAELHRRWAEMKAEEALQARKEAKLAIEFLAQMISQFNVSNNSEDAPIISISSSSSEFNESDNSVDAPIYTISSSSSQFNESDSSVNGPSESIPSSSHSRESKNRRSD
nr:uncharacterized protein LOC113710277 [Coffea arabica]